MSDENKQIQDLIRYDVLTQDALKDVIRKVLEEVAVAGLPGDHHFFITFQTDHPGVRLSSRMRERYPEEMTIVIQHSYWDLKVTDSEFEIDLSFDDILERLRIPFDSLKGFYDPHVKFGVQFDTTETRSAGQDAAPDTASGREQAGSVPQIAQTRDVIKHDPEKASEKPDTAQSQANDEDPDQPTADVVSLDTFRKKK